MIVTLNGWSWWLLASSPHCFSIHTIGQFTLDMWNVLRVAGTLKLASTQCTCYRGWVLVTLTYSDKERCSKKGQFGTHEQLGVGDSSKRPTWQAVVVQRSWTATHTRALWSECIWL